MYILAPENEFREIIYSFSTIFGTKFVVCSNNFENRLTSKNLCQKLILNRDFALTREINQDHKLLILATVLS